MKIKDYEDAIKRLNIFKLEIKKFVLATDGSRNVSGVYGNLNSMRIYWDGSGRGFSFFCPKHEEEIPCPELLRYHRDKSFDLKF